MHAASHEYIGTAGITPGMLAVNTGDDDMSSLFSSPGTLANMSFLLPYADVKLVHIHHPPGVFGARRFLQTRMAPA